MKLLKNFNNDCKKKKNRSIEMAKYSYLDFKIHSVCNFICFKQGFINMTLPKGIIYSKINDDTT